MSTIREQLEARELEYLAPEAAKSASSRGRMRPEPPDPIRPVFQRDRDRVIHSKAFRRLKHKTQVFFAPTGDHYRTRLTHTLEVSQIARSIAKVLRLHEELTEAIALGHDLGHPPFGHAGERVIDKLVPGGFTRIGRPQKVRRTRGRPRKLTREKVIQIRELLPATPYGKVASMFGVSASTIRAIAVGRTWALLP